MDDGVALIITDLIPQSVSTPLELVPDPHGTLMFPGSMFTENHAALALFSLGSKHRLTNACMVDIMEMLSILFPSPNVFGLGSRELQRRYVQFESIAKVHHCCGTCLTLLSEEDSCTNHECMISSEPDCYFVELPLDVQLKEHFKGINLVS